jgi:tetratricopeptide (TPR) repeat protein
MSNLSISKLVLLLFFMAGTGAISTGAWGVEYDCGELKNYSDIGPWDYADPSSSVPTGADPMGRIKRVENVHFYSDIKNLNTKKLSIEQLTADIHYTLRVFPNHPLALYAISRLELLAGGKLPNSSATMFTPRVTAECFFDRALRFRPDDKDVRITYGAHLHLRKKFKEALEQYQIAESKGADSSLFYYNLGLLYADMKNWEKAVEYGQKAYDSGLDFPGLRQKLERAGYKI